MAPYIDCLTDLRFCAYCVPDLYRPLSGPYIGPYLARI